MRLLILNPNTSEDFTRAIQKAGEPPLEVPTSQAVYESSEHVCS